MEPALAASASVPARVRVLFGIFVASGVCGLIYESIWSHYLKLFVGHAAYAPASSSRFTLRCLCSA